MMSYEEYSQKMTSYELAVQKLGGEIHNLGPSHPIKKYLRSLIAELKTIPEETLTKYLEKRHKALFSNGDPFQLEQTA